MLCSGEGKLHVHVHVLLVFIVLGRPIISTRKRVATSVCVVVRMCLIGSDYIWFSVVHLVPLPPEETAPALLDLSLPNSPDVDVQKGNVHNCVLVHLPVAVSAFVLTCLLDSDTCVTIAVTVYVHRSMHPKPLDTIVFGQCIDVQPACVSLTCS